MTSDIGGKVAGYKIFSRHLHKINTEHSGHILANVEILAGCVQNIVSCYSVL